MADLSQKYRQLDDEHKARNDVRRRLAEQAAAEHDLELLRGQQDRLRREFLERDAQRRAA